MKTANYKKLLLDGINVMMSNPHSVAIFRNKKKTNLLLKKIGVPTPDQYSVHAKQKIPVTNCFS